jgi:hypothetical protein
MAVGNRGPQDVSTILGVLIFMRAYHLPFIYPSKKT